MTSFLAEDQLPSSWTHSTEERRCYIYRGASMFPTFHPGQLLEVVPIRDPLSKGDVITFLDAPANRYIVHRVIAVTGSFVITRGDNNLHADVSSIPLEQVIGKVRKAEVHGILVPVLGGRRGLIRAKLRWFLLRLDFLVRTIFGKSYLRLRKSGVMGHYWHPVIERLILNNGNGQLIKYIYKHRAVAVWDVSRNMFKCDKPFDLIIQPPEEYTLETVSGRPDDE